MVMTYSGILLAYGGCSSTRVADGAVANIVDVDVVITSVCIIIYNYSFLLFWLFWFYLITPPSLVGRK